MDGREEEFHNWHSARRGAASVAFGNGTKSSEARTLSALVQRITNDLLGGRGKTNVSQTKVAGVVAKGEGK